VFSDDLTDVTKTNWQAVVDGEPEVGGYGINNRGANDSSNQKALSWELLIFFELMADKIG
jgi:hypothetical protein